MEQATRTCLNCKKPFRPRPGHEAGTDKEDKYCLSCYLIFCKQMSDERKEKADNRELDKAAREYQQPSLLPGEDEEDENTVVKVIVLPEQRKRIGKLAMMKGMTMTDYLNRIVNAL